MRFGWKMGALCALAVLCLGGASLAAARTTTSSAPPGPPAPQPGPPHHPKSQCDLGAAKGPGKNIKHVIYLQFDNTHFNRDNPDVRPTSSRCRTCSTSSPKRHAVHERPHDPDLAHGGRDPELADGPLPRPARARRSRTATTTSSRRRRRHRSRARSSTGRTRSTRSNDPLPNMVTDGQKNDARAVGPVHPRRL